MKTKEMTLNVLTMNTNPDNKIVSRPLRYIAIMGSTAKSCRRLKLLLKGTGYYCLVDCYKNSRELNDKESFYLPDCVIIEVRSLFSMFAIGKKAEKLKETFPGIKVVIYYNMIRRYPLLKEKNSEYPAFHFIDDEKEQVRSLEETLQNERI
jgi:hypothetical protein